MTRTASIIIPCWNETPSNLLQAVQSALDQNYPSVEVIVVDDGSTDEATIEALNSLDGVQLIRQDNKGLGLARNAGISRASGHFIFPLDSDNWLEKTAIRELVAHLEAAPQEVRVAYPKRILFGGQSGEAYAPARVQLPDLVYLNSIDAGALFRKEDWAAVGGYVKTDGPEDWIFWVLLLGRLGGRMELVREAALHYRVKPVSLNTKASSPAGLAEARSFIAEMLPEHAPFLYVKTAEAADNWRRRAAQDRADLITEIRSTELLRELSRRAGLLARRRLPRIGA